MKAGMTTTGIFAARPCGMEARDEPQYRTQVNPSAGWSGPGECASKHEARYPTVTGAVVGAAIAGYCSSLPQEISTSPPRGGRAAGGNDVRSMPVEKSDHPIVVTKPGNAGGAKGVAG
jgi:hypothetical protein